jgi:DNA-binding SARP family transcriptional activator/TolB-like protein
MTGVEVGDHSLGFKFRRKRNAPPQDTLEISVLGNVSVSFKGQCIRVKSRKSLAVLAYIALNESRQETRERLVGLFWSETGEEKARASLRQTLRELRRYFAEAGYSGLKTEKLAIELDPGSFAVDLWDVLREAKARRVHPLLLETQRLTDRLLHNLDDIDPSFRAWVLAKRQTLHDRLLRTLEDNLRDAAVDARTRRQIAEALVSLDPTHEEACRSLMKSRAEEGDVATALRIYKTLWDLLDEDYDMEPSAKTQQLVAEIKQGTFEPVVPLAPPPSAAPTTTTLPQSVFNEAGVAQPHFTPQPEPLKHTPTKIALLVSQFQINGVDADKIHLVHGFRHHLIASLIRFREWSVVDDVTPTSGIQQRPTPASQYSIAATAYQAGITANVVLTLRQNETNTFIWSESFELTLKNWFETQQRIIRRITTSLNVQLSTERLMRLAREPDVSLEIYDRWLRAQVMITSFKPDDWERAAEIFTDTIRLAPNFSPCFSGLVQMNNGVHFVHPGVLRDMNKAQQTLALARSAVQLDPVDSRAQLCLGWSLTMAKQYDEAERYMSLACELNENDPWTLISASAYYAFCGRFDRAAALASEAFELSLAPSALLWGYRAIIEFLCGKYSETLDAADRANDIIKTLPAWKAAALYHLGHRDESIREAERFRNSVRSAWFGTSPPTDSTVARWLLHAHPIRRREDWERLRDGIRGAGVPVDDIKHHDW